MNQGALSVFLFLLKKTRSTDRVKEKLFIACCLSPLLLFY